MSKFREDAWEPYVGRGRWAWIWVDEDLLPDRVGETCRLKSTTDLVAWVVFEDGKEIIAPVKAVKVLAGD